MFMYTFLLMTVKIFTQGVWRAFLNIKKISVYVPFTRDIVLV